MKAGWEVKKLGELCEILDRLRKPITKRNRVSGPYPYYGATGVLDHVEGYLFDEMLVLLGEDGAKWEAGANSAFSIEGKTWVNNHAHVMRPNREILDDNWLIYYLNFSDLMPYVSGMTVPKLNQGSLREIQIPLPPLEEQKRIVSILDEAFEGLDRARENAEANLKSARELFGAHLKSIFLNNSLSWETDAATGSAAQEELSAVGAAPNQVSKRNTKTGGRAAAEQHILGNFSLSVKIPYIAARKGWKWSLLTDLARLESGHTPSRRKPEYWSGDISWIGIKDARDRHGLEIVNTLESTNDLGIDNSSARVLPKGTVCLSRTASVGYVTIMGRDMATSQDFVNWVCGPELDPEFLKIIFLAQETEFMKFSSGAVHQTIYFPQAKAFAICHPNVHTQKEIVKQANAVLETTKAAHANCQSKLQDISDLRQSLLQKAFAGELT